ncbi:MAG: hypothetical protein LBI31_07145 [Zoogloeaceae bacterium]|jgi:diacylglycerol kinase family enzyme|nr:hypothetical protein [Zoogloeaceae bacterium]
MKHLFIVNPAAKSVVNHLPDIRAEIEGCFVRYPWLSYDIHVTRWQRDAVGFIRNYCQKEPGLVRIYAVGGSGILYEVINGAVGLPNVQIACYARSGEDDIAFIRSLGKNIAPLFESVGDLIFAETRQVDLIRCDNSYALSFSMFGMEAMAGDMGEKLFSGYRVVPSNLCYFCAAMYNIFRSDVEQNYRILLDDEITLEGSFLGALIANQPCYGKSFLPGVDARPDSGMLDLYLWNQIPRGSALKILNDYMRGQYRKWPEYIRHYSFRKMNIRSDDLIAISLDGEFFYQTEVEYEILPGAVDFVCPEGFGESGQGVGSPGNAAAGEPAAAIVETNTGAREA